MDNLIIYHNADLDGLCSAAIAKKAFPDAELLGIDHDYPVPVEIISSVRKNLIIVDFSFKISMNRIAALVQPNAKTTWIDHHISAIDNYMPVPFYNITAVLHDGVSACELTWRHFFPNIMLPVRVHLLGIYDTWRKSERPTISPVKFQYSDFWKEVVLPFQYYCRAVITEVDHFTANFFVDSFIDEMIWSGNLILLYQQNQNRIVMRSSYVRTFHGYRALVINQGKVNSTVFDSFFDPELHDIMLAWHFNGKGYKVSLYTTKDINLALIAESYGGGGHAKAAGFFVNEIKELL